MISNISDKIVFNALKNIKYGRFYLTNFNGEKYTFGKDNEILKVNTKINKPGFTLDVVNKGSIGLAEAYMRGDFETDNLSELIEITARNIKLIHRFSGVLDFPIINFIKNTFGEQHTYIFKTDNDKLITNNCTKKFHVSPFINMECHYCFRVLKTTEKISIIIDQKDNEGKLLYASQDGKAKELNEKNLIFSYICHPLMTFKIIAAIHFEALKLWFKGIKVIKRKLKIKNNISIEEK